MNSSVSVLEAASLGTWAEAWDGLTQFADPPTPFLRSWWLEGVGGAGDLFVLIVDGDTLIGGMALERRRILGLETLRVLGAGKLCPDHLDLLTVPERADEVNAALRNWFGRPGSRIVDLEGIREGSRVIDALPSARSTAIDVAIFEPLPASVAEYLAARSKSFASRMRRYENRTLGSGVTYRRVGCDENQATMAKFIELHSVRDDRQELMREMPRLERAVVLGDQRGEIRMYVAEREGRTGAVLLGFVTDNRFNVFQMARSFDAEFNHVGLVLYIVAIRESCEEGIDEFDFLRGAEPYKYSFVSIERKLFQIQSAHGIGGHAALLIVRLCAKSRARLGAWRARMRAKVTAPKKIVEK